MVVDGNNWVQYTVKTNKAVDVVVNPSESTPLVELTLVWNADERVNTCPADGGTSETRRRGNNQVFWIAACDAGTAMIELQDPANGNSVTTYTFAVTSDDDNEDAIPPTTSPSKPVISKTIPGSTRGQVELDWGSTRNTTSYRVYQQKNGSYERLGSSEVTINFSASKATVSGLNPDVSAPLLPIYRFKVAAVKNNVEVKSNSVAVHLRPAPENLGSVYRRYGKVSLTWDPVHNPDATYIVQQRWFAIGVWETLTQGTLGNAGVRVSTPTLNTATNRMEAVVDVGDVGRTFWHRVKADSAQGESGWSNEANEEVPDERPTGRVKDVEIERLRGGRGLILKWDVGDVSGASEYKVDAVGTGSVVDSLVVKSAITRSGDKRSIKLTNLLPSRNYRFDIYPSNAAGDGPKEHVGKRAPVPIFSKGHQSDHTAYYRNGTFAPTAQTAIKKHIHDAAKAWNTAISEHDLLICNDLLPTTNPDRIPCNGQNSDGYTTTVKSVETTETTWTGGCRTSFACVTNIDLHGLLPGVLGKHRGDMDLVLESPGFSCDEDDDGCDRAIKYLWLDNPSKHFMFVNGTDHLRGYYAYPLYVLVHEFGHLFGLPDFYKYDEWENSDAVMKTSSRSTISNDDLNQLYAIYARHLRH